MRTKHTPRAALITVAAGLAVGLTGLTTGCSVGSDTARYTPSVQTAGPSIYGPGPARTIERNTTVVALPQNFGMPTPPTAGPGAANESRIVSGPVYNGPVYNGVPTSGWNAEGGEFQTAASDGFTGTPMLPTQSFSGTNTFTGETGASFSSNTAVGIASPAYENPGFENPAYQNPAYQNTFPVDTTTGTTNIAPEPPAESEAWNINAAVAAAESSAPQTAIVPVGEPSIGPNMSTRLYGDILDARIPETDGPDGFGTINIRQATFTNDGSVFDATVSADGNWLLFASTQHSPASDLYAQPVGSRVVTRLTTDPAQDVMPSISPDGERIAFASDRNGNWDIWVMPSAGGQAMQVTSDATHDLHPSWSPDGTHLVFCRLGQQSGRWELWTVDVSTPTQSQFIGYGLFPEWSPISGTGFSGGDQILFQRSRERGERTFAVWTIEYNRATQQAGNEAQIVSDPDAALINPNWSPDGRFVTYAAIPNPGQWVGEGLAAVPPSASIWMIGSDGTSEVPLTRGTSVDMMPTWSPSGTIFFVSNRSGAENLWSVEVGPAMYAAMGVRPEGVRSAFAESAENAGPMRTATGIENPNSNNASNPFTNRPGGGTGNAFVTAPTDQP